MNISFDSIPSVWSDDDWLKKFYGKTLEENEEKEGSEPPKADMPEVRSKAVLPEQRLVLAPRKLVMRWCWVN